MAVVNLGSAPGRYRARPVQGEAAADQLRAALDPLVKADAAADAEAAAIHTRRLLSFEARAEAAHRVAWIYYVLGRDPDARRVADTWRQGAAGEWAAQAPWISGLASWRLTIATRPRPLSAGRHRSRRSASSAAGGYWAARSEKACRRPRAVAPLLKAAARSPESFYGLVARETLGMDTSLPPEPARGPPASNICPTSAGRWSWPRSASARWPRNCFAIRREIGAPAGSSGADRWPAS